VKPLDSKLLARFLRLAGDNLKGEWLLVGGTLLPAVGIDSRPTVDIDLVRIGGGNEDQSLELMRLANSLDLSVESINQAAAFFVKQSGFKKIDLLPLYTGKSATIHRPSVELYWKLKLERFSDSDAGDCLDYYAYCKNQNDPINVKALKTLLDKKKRHTASKRVHRSLDRLIKVLR
jgi:hypothetical protein